MSRWIAIVGAVALFGVGCGVPEEYEGEEAISQEVQSEATLQEQPSGDFGIAVTCQPGTYVGFCYDWGEGCFENKWCGPGCKTYNNWKCRQYRVTISGTNYYYQQFCDPYPTLSCGAPEGPKCSRTCT